MNGPWAGSICRSEPSITTDYFAPIVASARAVGRDVVAVENLPDATTWAASCNRTLHGAQCTVPTTFNFTGRIEQSPSGKAA
jgi:hypothetical protein